MSINKNNAKHYLPFIQALADGKSVEIRVNNKWKELVSFTFQETPINYRIKPEPREWDMRVMPNGCLGSPVLNCPNQLIRVREVLDENNN